ncbi:carbohydrate esterase family 1 protein [Plicaturopsis crispa FD-325 SS-3]|nr:carbohydrate esterase family 1 protein [Plicaturopsis crispa FD-325 SS-3]
MPRSFAFAAAISLAALQCVRAASSGCGSKSAWSFDSSNHLNQTIGNRSFLVHLPSSYDSSVAAPVVLSFHGYNGSDSDQELISGFSDDALKINNTGIIAVYPLAAYGPGKSGNQAITAWQGAPYAPPGVDDVAFTENIISELQSNLCVDPNRIYAAGKSEGGGFAHLLACTNTTSALIAAFAPVSAAIYPGVYPTSGCNPNRSVPIINFHGLNDTIVPFAGRPADTANGGPAYALPNVTVWREAWASRNGCPTTDPSGLDALDAQDASEMLWDCLSTNIRAIVTGYTIDGLGHSWPTTLGLDGDKALFNATPEYIVPFFDAHPFGQDFAYISGAIPRTPWSLGHAVLMLIVSLVCSTTLF